MVTVNKFFFNPFASFTVYHVFYIVFIFALLYSAYLIRQHLAYIFAMHIFFIEQCITKGAYS